MAKKSACMSYFRNKWMCKNLIFFLLRAFELMGLRTQ